MKPQAYQIESSTFATLGAGIGLIWKSLHDSRHRRTRPLLVPSASSRSFRTAVRSTHSSRSEIYPLARRRLGENAFDDVARNTRQARVETLELHRQPLVIDAEQ